MAGGRSPRDGDRLRLGDAVDPPRSGRGSHFLTAGSGASRDRWAYVALVTANVFWAGNFLLGAVAVRELTPVQLTFLRWLIALPILALLAVLIERPQWRAALREWPIHIVQALTGILGFTLLTYEALRHTDGISAALIGGINPALIAISVAIFFGTTVRAGAIVGIVISFLGVIIVLLDGDLGTLLHWNFNPGQLIMLGAVLCWTAYSVVGQKVRTPPITATTLQVAIGLVLLLPFALAGGFIGQPLSAEGLWALIYIGVCPSVISFVSWNLATRRIGPGRAGIFLNLLPLLTAILGVVLGAALGLPQVLGGALIIAGVIVTQRTATRAHSRQP